MSMDECGNGGKAPESQTKMKSTRSRVQKVRKHLKETINSNVLCQYLDRLYEEGRTVLCLNISRDIGGSYEVISYKEEANG